MGGGAGGQAKFARVQVTPTEFMVLPNTFHYFSSELVNSKLQYLTIALNSGCGSDISRLEVGRMANGILLNRRDDND